MMRKTFRAIILYLLALTLTPSCAWGGAPLKDADSKAIRMEEIVVTATRSEMKKEEIPAVVDIITKKELDTTVDENLTRILKKNTSVDVIDYPGVLSGISIRGFRPEFSGITKHYLVLIDGRPAGATNIATILKNNVERIEVLKGPGSALYGAEAMGGVINIITRKSTGKPTASVAGGAGSWNTYFARADAGGKITDWLDFDVGAGLKNQDDDFDMGGGKTRANTSFKERYGNLRIGTRLGEHWRVDAKGDFYLGRDILTPNALYYGDDRPSSKDIDRYGGDLTLEGTIGDHDPRLTLYAAHEDSEYTKMYAGQPRYKSYEGITDWLGFQAQDTFHWREHDLTVGIDYQDIDVESKSWKSDGSRRAPYSPDNERKNVGLFGDLFLRLFDERVMVNAGIRYDWFELTTKKTPYKTDFHPGSETFSQVSPRAGVKLFLDDDHQWQIHTTVGSAFVPPKANQMAGYSEREVSGTIMILKGNPDLDPESSWTWDAGITWRNRHWGLWADLTYFYTEVDDKISRVKLSSTESTYKNMDSARMSGLEMEVRWDLGRLFRWDRTVELFFNSTYLFTYEEKVPGQEAEDIHNVAEWKFNTGVRYDDGMFFGRLLARYVSDRKDYDWYAPGYPVITYHPFTVWDASLGVRVTKHCRLTVNIENLFDKYYMEKPEYPLPGRSVYGQIQWTF